MNFAYRLNLEAHHVLVKTTLDIRPGQKQRISPYLKQSVSVLKASSKTLRETLELALELNPFVDTYEEALANDPIESPIKNGQSSIHGINSSENSDFSVFQTSLKKNSLAWNDVERFENFSDNNESEDLAQKIRDALSIINLDSRKRIIAEALIGNIDDRGYLDASFEEIRQILGHPNNFADAELEEVLSQIQEIDPPGIGSRNLKECLLVQIRKITERTPGRRTAEIIIENHLELVAQKSTKKLMCILGVTSNVLSQAVNIIRSLDPEPGLRYSNNKTTYISPDVIVRKKNGAWIVELNPYLYPLIRINPEYDSSKILENNKASKDFIASQLKEARWLIQSLNKRQETIIRIANEIIKHQERFFYHEELQPLTQRWLSKKLQLHPSTISRAIHEKYMLTPRGTFEFRDFFASKCNNSMDPRYSTSMVKIDVRKMIESESPENPFSDQEISLALQKKGIYLARRTVTKYRQQMLIPASTNRHPTL